MRKIANSCIGETVCDREDFDGNRAEIPGSDDAGFVRL